MKLYTEDQLRNALIDAKIYEFSPESIIEDYTPIKLPSDDEIEEEVEPLGTLGDIGFIEGAKWVIEQIKQQDNDR